jgi:hypothetical protein
MLRSLYNVDLNIVVSCLFNKTASNLIFTKLELERVPDSSLFRLLKFQVGEQKNLLELSGYIEDPRRMAKQF